MLKTSLRALLLSMLLFCGVAATGLGQQVNGTNSMEYSIAKVTMAVTNVEKMVAFYEQAFQTRFTRFEAYGASLYQGLLFGMPTLFCPNSIAGVNAEQSRHQFDLLVRDFDAVLARVADGGGTVRDQTPAGEEPRMATVLDPDGNTIVVIEERK